MEQIIKLKEHQLELLNTGLRFCELRHPFYKGEFKNLLNEITKQISQESLFVEQTTATAPAKAVKETHDYK